MGVFPGWGLQIWALTSLAQMARGSGFFPVFQRRGELLWSPSSLWLDECLPWHRQYQMAAAPEGPGTSCRWWEQQNPGRLSLTVLSPLSAQIVGVCGLPWAGQLHTHSGTLLHCKKPAGELQMVFTLSKSFVQDNRGGTGQGICPADFGT